MANPKEIGVIGARINLSRRDFLKFAGASIAGLATPSSLFGLGEKASERTFDPEFTEMLPSEDRRGVLTAQNMPVTMFPIGPDYFYNYNLPVNNFNLDGVEIGYSRLFYSEDSSGRGARYTILPHTTGARVIPIAQFDRGTLDKEGCYTPETRFYSTDNPYGSGTSIGEEHTILAEFYPNKIVNILEALRAIDEYQMANGGFVAGREYSLLDILALRRRNGYVVGYTSSREQVIGGGVCIIATNLSKLLAELGAEVTERWMHPSGSRYSSSPFAGWELRQEATDATIDMSHGGAYDLRWVFEESGYLKLTEAVIPNGRRVNDNLGDEATGGAKADAIIITTMKWSQNSPGPQSAGIEMIKQRYLDYRATNRSGQVVCLRDGNRFNEETHWNRGDNKSVFLQSIAPEERVERYRRDLETNEFYSTLVRIRSLLNSYGSGESLGLGEYLRQSEWYTRQVERLRENQNGLESFESALRHLDANMVPGQPMQCVGFAILLSALHFPGYDFKNIGGALDEGGNPISCAARLVPSDIRSGARITLFQGGYLFQVVENLDDIHVGDLFVVYNTTLGHVGGIIGKKTIEGKTVLLFAAANQSLDGLIKIFEVDGDNFDVVMGPPPYKKVVVR